MRSAGLASLWALIVAGCASGPGTAALPPPMEPANLAGAFLISRYAALNQEPTRATDALFRALALSPKNPEILEQATRAALQAGDFSRAVLAADRARATGNLSPPAALTLASAAFADDRAGAAAHQLRRIEGLPAEQLAQTLVRVWALAADGREKEALAALGPDDPQMPLARLIEFHRAALLERMGETEAALALYARSAGSGLRIGVAAELGGAAMARAGQRDAAIALYRETLKGLDSPELARALAQLEQGGPAPALAPPRRIAAMGIYAMAAVLASDAPPEDYTPYLTIALALDPTLDAARYAFASAALQQSRFDAALGALREIPPERAYGEQAALQAAWVLSRAGRKDEALAMAHAAAERAESQRARVALADLYRSLERWSEAETLYSGAIAAGGEQPDWRYLFARGVTRERQGRWRDAERDLQAALAIAPDEPELLNYIAYGWVERGENLADALAKLQRAASLAPQASHIRDSLGWAYFRLGRVREALDHLEEAARLEPDDLTINDHLGDVYWRLGRRLEARLAWRRALGDSPNAADRARIEAKIAGGPAGP